MEDTCKGGPLREEVGKGKDRKTDWAHAPGSPEGIREAGPFLERKGW